LEGYIRYSTRKPRSSPSLQDASIFEAVHGSAPDIAGEYYHSFVMFRQNDCFVRQGFGESNGFVVILPHDVKVDCYCTRAAVTVTHTYFRHMNLNPYADKIEKAALTVSV
jgi:hypothetical protein